MVQMAATKSSEPLLNTESFAENTAAQSMKCTAGINEVGPDSTVDKAKDMQPTPGNALAAASNSEETKRVHQEMSNITAAECPFLMNKE